ARGRALLAERLSRRGIGLTVGALATALAGQGASAGVPSALLSGTLQAALLLSGGHAAVTGGSSRVAALMEGAVEAMVWAKLKVGAVLVAVGLLLGGAGLAAYQTKSAQPERQDAPKPPEGQPLEQAVRLDLHGDPLPPGAVARLGTVRWRHAGPTTFAAFLPDGQAGLPATSAHATS